MILTGKGEQRAQTLATVLFWPRREDEPTGGGEAVGRRHFEAPVETSGEIAGGRSHKLGSRALKLKMDV